MRPGVVQRRVVSLFGIAFVAGVFVWSGCRSEHNLTDEHGTQTQDVLSTGLNLDGGEARVDAPRMRADTIRALGHLEGDQFDEELQSAIDAEDPTVRTAAVRAVLESDHPRSEPLVRRALSRSNGDTTRAILHAVFDYAQGDGGHEAARAIASDYMWQGLGPDYAPGVRRVAFQRGVKPLITDTVGRNETKARKELLPKLDSTTLGRLDTAIGGAVLRFMASLDEADRATPLIDLVTDRSASTDRRIRAARILRDARLKRAKPAFQSIIDRAEFNPDNEQLGLPDSPVPAEILKEVTLGLVAIGDTKHIRRAKSYMTGAGVERFIDVLDALAHNPDDAARIAVKNALQDARPRVRHRAIRLWAEREGTDAEPILNLLQHESFERQPRQTRYVAAEVLARHFPERWRTQMKRQLTSDEGIRPALDMLIHLQATPRLDISETLRVVREPLVEIASNSENASDNEVVESNAGRAARLLVPFADSPDIVSVIKQSASPAARYALLEFTAEGEPTEQLPYILDNFYGKHPGPDLFGVRMMAAVAIRNALN